MSLLHLPHHDGSPLYVSDEAPTLGDTVTVRVRTSAGDPVDAIWLRTTYDAEPVFHATTSSTSGDVVWWEARLPVHNPVTHYRFLLVRGEEQEWLTGAGLVGHDLPDFADFRLTAFPEAPDWGRDAVVYQVFPDRFARSAAADGRDVPDWALAAEWDDEVAFETDDPRTPMQLFGGDLDGITEHLDHVADVGADVVYTTPVFPGESNHRYNATTFTSVDPLLGGDEAYARLSTAVHARGWRILGDLTTNHTGDTHEWFTSAKADPDNPHRSFYYFDDDGTYACWMGHGTLPKINHADRDVRHAMVEGPDSVVGRWLRPPYDVDGWRIDVANMTGRYREQDLNAEVRQTIRRTMIEANPDTVLFAEVTNDAASDFPGDAWHGAMTYPSFTRPVWAWLSEPGSSEWFFGLPYPEIPQWSGEQVYESHRRFTAAFPWRTRVCTMNALDTHDTARFATWARPGAVRVAVGLSMTVPGIPVVFAGDEFGHTGMNGEHSRTTMPWSRVDEHAETIDLYAELIALRRAHPALSHGGMRWLHASAHALVFVRETAEESILVCAARADADIALPASAIAGDAVRVTGEGELADARIRSRGMSFTAWSLPGVALPAFGSEEVPAAR